MAAVAAQLTNAFNLLPETECCGLYAAKALINHSRDPGSRPSPIWPARAAQGADRPRLAGA